MQDNRLTIENQCALAWRHHIGRKVETHLFEMIYVCLVCLNNVSRISYWQTSADCISQLTQHLTDNKTSATYETGVNGRAV